MPTIWRIMRWIDRPLRPLAIMQRDAWQGAFAKALDRLQPLLLNTLTGGGTCTENLISESQVHERYGPTIERGSATLWRHAQELVQRHFHDSNDEL